MSYRRFGRTELRMPVITCGGMRFQQAWNEDALDRMDSAGQANLAVTMESALALGINHFETARGYGSSEYQMGFVLRTMPRERILVQTKIGPRDSEQAFLDAFAVSLQRLQVEYVDLLAVHGINSPAALENTLRNGTLAACRRLQREGRVRHVGASSHGGPALLLDIVATGEFSYINLHWFYVDQRNAVAIAAAAARDMGVFIISPCDKGGRLYDPPERLRELCAPLTPMQFNDLFCLRNPQVHTLSIGAARPSDFDEHVAAVVRLAEADGLVSGIEARLRAALVAALGEAWVDHWSEGLPEWTAVPGGVPLYHVLRLYNLAKGLGMERYARDRYNLLGQGDDWFPGNRLDKLDWDRLPDCLGRCRFRAELPGILREAGALLHGEEVRRLSQHA